MPKKDAFADQKKEGAKASKKMQDVKMKEAKIAKSAVEEEDEVEVPVNRNDRSLKVAANTTFTKAAAAAAEQEDEAEDYDYDADETQASASAPAKKKEESKADLKKKEKKKKNDEFAHLAEQELLAKKQRIKDRFLRMLVVGIVMDFFKPEDANGNGNSEAKKKAAPAKKAKKSNGDETDFSFGNIKKQIELFSGPLIMAIIVLAVLYGKAMEDTYGGGFDSEAANLYDVMGVPRDSAIMDVRKKYKSLALTWHPDKNPECKECPEKFAAISKAYEVLSDVDKKKAYDSNKAQKGSFGSAISVDLTAEDFEAKVLRSNEVWLVQVYDPSDGPSSSFHPIWEEAANTYQHVAKFGRIDVSKHKKATDFLPQRVVIMPIIFRFARGEVTDSWMWQGNREEEGARATAGLAKFLIGSYPALQQTEGADAVTSFWKKSDRSRLLISGNGGVIKRGAQNKQFFRILKEAHLWGDYFAVTTADAKEVVVGLKDFKVELPEADKKKGHPWSVTYIPAGETDGSKAQIAETDDLKELPGKIEEIVSMALSKEAPSLTIRNHRQLCGAGAASRTFCLVLVDMPDNKEVGKVLTELAASRAEYATELAEMKNNEEENSERQADEPFQIQAVRVMTGTSRWPSQPVAVGSTFYTAWAEVDYAPMFVVELETQRVSAVKPAIVAQLCQQIAYEDLKFKELPEGFHLARALPDPEVSLKKALFRKLSTPLGAIFAFVFLAAVTAVAPELDVVTNAACGSVLMALLVAAWPLAFRRLLSFGARV